MGIYGYMQPYIQSFRFHITLENICMHLVCICLHGYLLLITCIYADMCVYRCILACIWSCSTSRTTTEQLTQPSYIASIMLLAYSPASCVAPIALVQFSVASINSDQHYQTYFDPKILNIYKFICNSPIYSL